MGDKTLYLDISEYTHDGMDGTCCGAAENLWTCCGSPWELGSPTLGESVSTQGRCPTPNAAGLVPGIGGRSHRILTG